jgi:hypothetical protein
MNWGDCSEVETKERIFDCGRGQLLFAPLGPTRSFGNQPDYFLLTDQWGHLHRINSSIYTTTVLILIVIIIIILLLSIQLS